MIMTCNACGAHMTKVYRFCDDSSKELFMCPVCKRETKSKPFSGFMSKGDKSKSS